MLKKSLPLVVILFALCFTHEAQAASVSVTLPNFTVELNGQSMDNRYSRYPLLVYKDITYFPMTYYDCKLLGLTATWTAEQGLSIDKTPGYFYEYMRDVLDSKNRSAQQAQIAVDKITVNGKAIDNATEEYPLLVFRDITYFRLTWRFAVEEFGWAYHFEEKTGLVITANDVIQENPEEWRVERDFFAGMMGCHEDFYIYIFNDLDDDFDLKSAKEQRDYLKKHSI